MTVQLTNAEYAALVGERDALAVQVAEKRRELFRAAADDAIKQYGEQLLGRMIADGARDTSDAEIERTLAGCVCGPMLVLLAKEMRERGLLKWTLRDALAKDWVDLVYEAATSTMHRQNIDNILNWDALQPVSQDIIKTTQQAEALANLWLEQADRVRDVACERIFSLAWA
jgi:hypothetical protein